MNEAANDPRASRSGRRRRWLIYAAEVLLFILVLAGVHGWQTRDLPTGPAMALEGTLLDGRSASLSALRGRPVLVHFWATWCPVCKLEQDNINAIALDQVVISIAMQSGADKEVLDHMTQQQLTFPVINDADGALARRWGIRGVPTSFILDGTGHIRFVEVGYTTEAGLRLRLALAGALGKRQSHTFSE
jgi:thiol-disulfide isomerase/thioredoxin